MICSSGENVGGCTPENQGVETKRVVCGDFSMSPSGEVQIEPSGILDCQPKLWRGLEVSPQTHRVETTDAYECKAFVPGYPEDDHFDNPVRASSRRTAITIWRRTASSPPR